MNNLKHHLRQRALRNELKATGLAVRLDRAHQRVVFWQTMALLSVLWSTLGYGLFVL